MRWNGIKICALIAITICLNWRVFVGQGKGKTIHSEVIGIDADGFPNEDKMGLHLINLIRDRIGEVFLPYVHAHFEENDGQKILAIRCEKGPKAAYLKDGPLQRFFVRGGNATAELSGPSITEYVVKRFD